MIGGVFVFVQAVKSVACLFCGVGTAPAMINAVGMDAVGVDLCPSRCEKAEQLEFNLTVVVVPVVVVTVVVVTVGSNHSG